LSTVAGLIIPVAKVSFYDFGFKGLIYWNYPRVTGLVLTATTCVAAVVAFVVATEIFLILFLSMVFGVFLTKTASLVSRMIPIDQGACVAAVTTLLLVASMGSAAVFGVELNHQVSQASKHFDEDQVRLRETAERYPSVESVPASTPILSDFLWPNDERRSNQPRQDSDDSSEETEERPRANNSKRKSAKANGSDS